MTHDLIYPMFAMVVLTMLVGIVMFRTRVHAAKSGQVDPRHFKTFSFGEPTDAVLKTGRHFTNIFEVPTLFYAGCLAGMMVGVAGVLPLLFAWLFVFARVAHAWIHIGKNKIWPRVFAFMFGLACVFALWVCVLVRTIQISS
ncbi:MAG: MAPEG family protein [Bdellovibrionales bacterium]